MSTNAINPNDVSGDDFKSSIAPTSNTTLLMILAGVVLLAYTPMMIEHFKVLWELEQYQYFPFIIAAVGWLGWSRWKEASLREQQPLTWYQNIWHHWLPAVWTALAFVTLAVAVYCQWGWFAAVSLNLLTGAGLLILTKHFHIRNAWGIWCLMWLMVPPPIEFGANVVQRMQLASSQMSSQILDLLRIDHLLLGNIFTLPTKQLFVDEACSGIVSVMSVIAATGMYAVWKDRSLFHAGLLMLISVAWALVMNTVRIVAIAVAEAKFSIDIAEGTPHEILGLVLFALTFIASMSTDQFLEFLLSPIKVQPGETGIRRNPLVRFWNWAMACFAPKSLERNADQGTLNNLLNGLLTPKLMMVGAPIVGVGIWSTLVFFGLMGGKPQALVESKTLSESVTAETLAESIGAWTQKEYALNDRSDGEYLQGHYDFGQFSNSFTYGIDERIAQVSMDYPFSGGWHELSACYRAGGWDILERNARDEGGRPYVETTFKFPDQEQYGYLLFNNFNEGGEVFAPPSQAILLRSWLFVRRRFLRKIAGDLYQVQLFVVSDKPFTEEEKQQSKELFFEAEKTLTKHVASLGGGS